ncbi:sigma-70 family RNA polymerase sigma factor [Dactylosporangium roseum]|uniref:Sigma-70 family RNA polymerase sigma factor n=1 Tax=Dactylosporangium roseum TaxID=47989 RepID=A0ABY5Z335_9ACTN|nr:sigma-70 family RNA polymerase sigma factor [Dactylosporangium roseum]UWZ36416.1 sigma-70 family RNA polymerase sigma factor [Dactylosporangium roseum]
MTLEQLAEVDEVDAAGLPPDVDERFTRFYIEHHPALLKFVRKLCRRYRLPESRVDPQDIVQEVFLAAWTNWSTVDHPVRWTYVVARRRVGDRADTARRLPDHTLPEHDGRHCQPLEDLSVAKDEPFDALLVSEIYTAFLALPPQQRNATVLRHVAGFSSAEIAERLGCSTATADVHVHRGVNAVRQRLAEQEPLFVDDTGRRARRIRRLVTGAAAAAIALALAWIATILRLAGPAPDPNGPTPDPGRPWIPLGGVSSGGVSRVLIALGALLVGFGIVAIMLLLRRRDDE